MSNRDEIIRYTFVKGHVRRISSQKAKSFAVECAYSKGKGRDPASILISEDCPACDGTGWITLSGKPSDYRPCGNCQGKGDEPDAILDSEPCHICKGSGLVKVV
jgi:DnaJ-class molecular chaperone